MLQALTSTMRKQGYLNNSSTGLTFTFAHTVLLGVGNIAFIVAVFAAHSNPATGYEVDILQATPRLFWAGIGVALLSALFVLAFARTRVQWLSACGLLFLSGVAVPALPLLRGYYFYGQADALNHLGWVKSLSGGTLSFFDLVYPASHVFSAVIATLGNVTPERGMLIAAFVLACSFVAFTTLAIWTVLPNRTAVTIALVSGLLFLPVNHVAFETQFHTYSLTTFFFPFVLFLVLKHVTSTDDDPTLDNRLSSTDIGFAFGGTAIVFLHPQVAVNVIVFLGSLTVVQFVARRRYSGTPLARTKPVYGQFLFLMVVFLAWNVQFENMLRLGTSLANELYGAFFGTAQTGQIVAERADSAEGAGTNILTLFVRIFLVQAVYVLAAAGVVGLRAFGRLQTDRSETRIVVDVLSVTGIALVVFFLAHFVGDISGYFFRHVGFGVTIATVVATVGFYRIASALEERDMSLYPVLKIAAIVLAAVVLMHSLVVFYTSPYVMLPTSHVSEQQLEGYETTFEYAPEGVAFGGVRAGPERYHTATVSDTGGGHSWPHPSAQEMRSLRTNLNHDRSTRGFYYFFMTETDRKRELVAYNGYRYDRGAFESVPQQEGVSRIFTNGEVEAYQVLYSTPETAGPGG